MKRDRSIGNNYEEPRNDNRSNKMQRCFNTPTKRSKPSRISCTIDSSSTMPQRPPKLARRLRPFTSTDLAEKLEELCLLSTMIEQDENEEEISSFGGIPASGSGNSATFLFRPRALVSSY